MTEPRFRADLPRPPFPLFDCHVHLGASDTGEIYYPDLSSTEYRAVMDAANIKRACAFAPLREDGYRSANQQMLTWADDSGDQILAFARLGGPTIPLAAPQTWIMRRKLRFHLRGRSSDVANLTDLDRFAGVKLLPHLDGLPRPEEFARIAELHLPVLIHAGQYSTPRWIERVVLPQLRGPLIIAHLGSFPCEEAMLRDAVAIARRHANVYLDTSGAWMSGFVRYAVQQVPDKLVFGSDAPLTHPLVAWYHLASVIRDDATLERIGYTTAEEIFG